MLAVGVEIGSCLSELERVLSKHLELAKQTKVRKKKLIMLSTFGNKCMQYVIINKVRGLEFLMCFWKENVYSLKL